MKMDKEVLKDLKVFAEGLGLVINDSTEYKYKPVKNFPVQSMCAEIWRKAQEDK